LFPQDHLLTKRENANDKRARAGQDDPGNPVDPVGHFSALSVLSEVSLHFRSKAVPSHEVFLFLQYFYDPDFMEEPSVFALPQFTFNLMRFLDILSRTRSPLYLRGQNGSCRVVAQNVNVEIVESEGEL
jgi:hypothetical protein